jgi:ABC-type nickel/cobalt efflux system permease component RcnA
MIVFLTGLVAGIIHVWSGPDHLAAIAPLSVRRATGRGQSGNLFGGIFGTKKTSCPAWLPGAKWGMGHSAGVAIVGILSLLLRDALPLDLISSWGERLVGVMLLAIGIWALRKAFRVHSHEHEHDGSRHMHLHAHVHPLARTSAASPRTEPSPHSNLHDHPAAHAHHTHAALGIGILHGLAGSSHFLAVLPLLALPTRAQAIGYLTAFAIGTIFSMATFSTIMGLVAQRFARNSLHVYRGLMCACAASAMLVGSFWLFF